MSDLKFNIASDDDDVTVPASILDRVQTQISYRPAPTEIRRAGFKATQVKRRADIAIYGINAGFEVMRIRRHGGRVIAGNQIEPAEYLPSNEEFGTHGFYYAGPDARERAEQKLVEMLAADEAKVNSANPHQKR